MRNTSTSPATLLISVVRAMKSRLEKKLPLPFSQCEVLRTVAELEKPSMHELARRFRITAPSTTALVEPLVKAGYLVRKSDASDRRQIRLALTKKGKTVGKSLEKKRTAALEGLLSVLDRKDIQELERILSKIIAHAS